MQLRNYDARQSNVLATKAPNYSVKMHSHYYAETKEPAKNAKRSTLLNSVFKIIII